jgi:predicted outer membrane lipoprotein
MEALEFLCTSFLLGLLLAKAMGIFTSHWHSLSPAAFCGHALYVIRVAPGAAGPLLDQITFDLSGAAGMTGYLRPFGGCFCRVHTAPCEAEVEGCEIHGKAVV